MVRIFAAVVITLLTSLFISQPVLAFDPLAGACGGNTTSSVCTTDQTENPITGPNGIITKVINIISFGVGIAAVFAIIIAGFRFITAQGDPSALSSAKNTIIYAVIGLAVIAVAQTLVAFVINKL